MQTEAIHEDSNGFYVWKVMNRKIGEAAGTDNPVLKVEKARVTPGDQRVSFLGLWTFREVTITEGQEFELNRDLVVGKLTLPNGMEKFDGDIVVLDQQRWLLRPGDIVSVDLRGSAKTEGFYVKMDAILANQGRYFVFAVADGSEGTVAKRIEVSIADQLESMRRIEPVNDGELMEGMTIVADGARFLTDGERINVARETEATP